MSAASALGSLTHLDAALAESAEIDELNVEAADARGFPEHFALQAERAVPGRAAGSWWRPWRTAAAARARRRVTGRDLTSARNASISARRETRRRPLWRRRGAWSLSFSTVGINSAFGDHKFVLKIGNLVPIISLRAAPESDMPRAAALAADYGRFEPAGRAGRKIGRGETTPSSSGCHSALSAIQAEAAGKASHVRGEMDRSPSRASPRPEAAASGKNRFRARSTCSSEVESSVPSINPNPHNDGISVGCLPLDKCPLHALRPPVTRRADLRALRLDPQLEDRPPWPIATACALRGASEGAKRMRCQDIERHRDHCRLRAISIAILAAHEHIAAELLHTLRPRRRNRRAAPCMFDHAAHEVSGAGHERMLEGVHHAFGRAVAMGAARNKLHRRYLAWIAIPGNAPPRHCLRPERRVRR